METGKRYTTESSGIPKTMVDTNVLIYAHDVDDPGKHERATLLIVELQDQNSIVVSTQVLNEFYHVVTRPKRAAPLSHEEAANIIRGVADAWEVIPLTPLITLRALDAVPRHSLSFWDALVWAAARQHGIGVICSEDFQHDQEIEGVRFVNPFQVEQ